MCFRPAAVDAVSKCPKCGEELSPVDRECPNCGEPVNGKVGFSSAPGAPGAPKVPGAPSAPKAPGAPGAPKAPGL